MPETKDQNQTETEPRKKHLPLKIWLPVVLVAAFLVGYLAQARLNSWWPFGEQNQELRIKNQGNDITTWQTYRNEKYGFEVKYPNYLEIEHPYGEEETRFVTNGKETYYSVIVSELSGSVMYRGGNRRKNTLSASDLLFIDLYQRCKGMAPDATAIAPIEIGDINGFQADSQDECARKFTPWVKVIKNNRSYDLRFWQGSLIEYYDILSTFKFIK